MDITINLEMLGQMIVGYGFLFLVVLFVTFNVVYGKRYFAWVQRRRMERLMTTYMYRRQAMYDAARNVYDREYGQ
jgi:hypothetical protein